MSDINFLAKQQEIHESRVEVDRKATWWLIALIAVTAIIWGTAWGFNYYFRTRITSANKQTEQIKAAIAANANSEQEYLNFYEKIERLRELLDLRQGGTDSIVYTYAYFGQNPAHNSTLISTSYEYNSKELQVVIGCSNVFCVSDILKLINNDNFQKTYPQHLIAGLSRTDTGSYQITLNRIFFLI